MKVANIIWLLLAVSFKSSAIDWEWVNPRQSLSSVFALTDVPGTQTQIAGGEYATIHYTNDSWTSFTSAVLPSSVYPRTIRSMCFPSSRAGYATTGYHILSNQPQILKSRDQGRTWEIVYTGTYQLLLSDVSFHNEMLGYVTGLIDGEPFEPGRILRTIDGGTTWSETNTSHQMRGVAAVSRDVAIAVGGYGKVYRTVDGGITWSLVSCPSNDVLRDVAFYDELNGLIVGKNNTILVSNDAGATWSRATSPAGSNADYWEVTCAGTQSAVVVGLYGDLDSPLTFPEPVTVYSDNQGHTWLEGTPSAPNYLVSVNHLDGLEYVAGGAWGSLSRSDDGGNSWEEVFSYFTDTINDVHFMNQAAGVAVGAGGFVARTQNGGSNWETQHLINQEDLNCVTFSNTLNGVAVGANGFIAVTDDGGSTWTEANDPITTNDLNGVDFISQSAAIAVGDEGVVIFSFDGGENWQFSSHPYSLLMNLNDVQFTDTNRGYIVGDDNTILRTDDGGYHWQNISTSFRPVSDYCVVEFVDNDYGYVGGGGRVIKTDNGGNTWQTILDGGTTREIEVYGYSDVLLLGGATGVVHYSGNSGTTWDPIYLPTKASMNAACFEESSSQVFIAGGAGAILSTNGLFQSNSTGLVPCCHEGILANSRITVVNRSESAITICVELDRGMTAQTRIIDLSGRIISDLGILECSSGSNIINWDCSGNPSGLYFVQLVSPEHSVTGKLLLF